MTKEQMTKGQVMEEQLHDLLAATIKELHRRVTEEPQNLKASMVAQIISLLKHNGIDVQSMSKAKVTEAMAELDDDLNWDEWVLPPATDPVPVRVN